MARFSLRALLVVVGLTAFFFAALCNPTARWKIATHTMVLMLFSYGAIRACVPHSAHRVFWSAFVLTGLLWAIVAPWITESAIPYQALNYLAYWFAKPDPVVGVYSSQAAWAAVPSAFRDEFRDVGVPIVALLAGAIGGVYAEYLAGKNGKQ